MKKMRCKVSIQEVRLHSVTETIIARPVCRQSPYPENGLDEDNTFSKFSPSGEFQLTIANPDLLGAYKPGQEFYVDWTPIEKTA